MDEQQRRRDRRTIRQHVQRRKERWATETLSRVCNAVRPNAATFVQQPHVATLLQHLLDGLTELLLTRPLAPFPWLADYLRHACKLSYEIALDATSLLVLEMHKKRRAIERVRSDTTTDEQRCKQSIQCILKLQLELELSSDEHRLLADDLAFLAVVPLSSQDDWSIDAVSSVAFPTDAAGTAADDDTSHDSRNDDRADVAIRNDNVVAWLHMRLLPQRDLDAYYAKVLDGVVRALVHLQLVKPSDSSSESAAAKWLVAFLRGESDVVAPQSSASQSTLPLFVKTNYELLRRVDTLETKQRATHERLERLQRAHTQLEDERAMRDQFIATLATSHVTTRTHALMDGTPVFLNAQKHWVPPGRLLLPTQLSSTELLALRRAERYWMQRDELHWRHLLATQQMYDACVCVQAAWRRARISRAYRALTAKRRAAAVVIQRNYFRYLYQRAVRVPTWCVLGREVVVAPSVAMRCAVTFQFYPHKDFPTGNYRRLPPDLSVRAMMDASREDDTCAGFSTDGALKRFVPRKLSQLHDMAEPDAGTTSPRGLYVKVYPSNSESVVNTGVVVAVPTDRFGLVDVVLDGTGVCERVPLAKLSDRWRRVRIRRRHPRVHKAVKRTFVGGKASDTIAVDADDADDNEVHVDLHSNNASTEFETLDELQEREVEAAERRRERHQRRAAAAQTSSVVASTSTADNDDVASADAALLEFLYEDQATKRVVRREPQHTYADATERMRVIAARQQAYGIDQARKHEAKMLASVVRLQCAWRSKRAREAFRQVIALRAKEKAREQLVQQAHARHAHARAGGAATTPTATSKRFFAKLFRR